MQKIRLPLLIAASLSILLSGCGDDPAEQAKKDREYQEAYKKAVAEAEAEAAKPVDYILAFSWQPAFCETAPRKRECKTQKEGRYDVTNFTLHGLWPQPGTNVYCEVPKDQVDLDKQGQWSQLKSEEINEFVWRDLKTVMPGTMSHLHKHEWVKHGTCYSTSIDDYYAHSIWLVQRINASKLQDLFESNIGKTVSGKAIRKSFEETFGKGTGERLRISCRRDPDSGRNLITEITLGLSGTINGNKELSDLIMAAAPTKNEGCPKGVVDSVGFQGGESDG